jgi:Vitamin K-dependent gamma-carboxylase/TQO small subunit DoxD
MASWLQRWDAFWFPRATTRPLATARVIAVASQLLWFSPSLEKHLNLLETNTAFFDPQAIVVAITAVVPRAVFFTPSVFTALYWITAVAGLLALVGWWTRTSLFVFALTNWIFVAHEYSYGDRHHTEALLCIFLMTLAFSPAGNSLSIDALLRRRKGIAGAVGSDGITELSVWPLRLLHVLLAMTYLSTGLTKIVAGGPRWLNGYTLQGYTFADALNREIPFGLWLAQQHRLAIALSVFTILYETFFFVSLLVPWTAPYFFVTGILFHAGLYMAGGHDFFQHIVLLFVLLVCVPPAWLQAYANRIIPRRLAWWVQPVQAGR